MAVSAILLTSRLSFFCYVENKIRNGRMARHHC
jgi:hypothetical protein